MNHHIKETQELLQGIKSDTGEMVRMLKSMDRTLKNMDHWYRNTFGLTVEHMMLEEMPDPLEELLGERFIRTMVPELDFEGIDLVPDGIFEFERYVVIGEAKAGMVTLPRARNAIRQAKDHLKNFFQARKRKAWVRKYPFLKKEPLLLVYAARITRPAQQELLKADIGVGIQHRVILPTRHE